MQRVNEYQNKYIAYSSVNVSLKLENLRNDFHTYIQ